VVEEAPAPGVSAQLREAMGAAALQAACAIDYEGAGTVEFLLDTTQNSEAAFYFMEMNTRLQVEHAVTEMISGQDLVEWQFRVAAGEALPLSQEQLSINGHSFEARIYAEDPDKGFLPATGTLAYLQAPDEGRHIRVDTGVLQGDEVSVYYDPMIAKLVVWDESRERALLRLSRALSEYRISGVTTNIAFLYNLVTSRPFVDAELDTGFIEQHHDILFQDLESDRARNLPLASLFLLLRMEQNARAHASESDPWSPWNASNAWRLNEPALHTGAIVVNGVDYEVPVEEIGGGKTRRFRITAAGKSVMATGELEGNELYSDIDGYRRRVTVVPHDGQFTLFTEGSAMQFSLAQPGMGEDDESSDLDGFLAPMNGLVVKLLAEPGAVVKKDEPVIIMEAMKMEHTLCAPADGKVVEYYFQVGDRVDGGVVLLDFEQES